MSINSIGIIFSNMHDEEMHEITNSRTTGALPFGGRYRLIDFPLSNMHNSGITSVGVIAKSHYQSLLEHLGSGKEWDLSRKREGLFIFPPFSYLSSGIYKNKIEALHGIMTYIKKSNNDYVVITDCDVICNMNWEQPLNYHISKKADVTVLYYRIKPKNTVKNEVVYTISNKGMITDIKTNQDIDSTACIGTNMWIIGKSLLVSMIEDAMAHNLENIEKDIFQKKLNIYKLYAWELSGYIRKVNSICDYFHANMDLLNPDIRNDLFYKNGPIYTKVLDVIPAKYGNTANVTNSLIADGCIIEGQVENCILFRNVMVGKGSRISNSIIMKDTKTGENVNLNYIIADKDALFNDNRVLIGCESHPIYISKGSKV